MPRYLMGFVLALALGFTAPASATDAPNPLIAEGVLPFPDLDGNPDVGLPFSVLGIRSTRAVHDRARGTIKFEMRLRDPLHTQQRLQGIPESGYPGGFNVVVMMGATSADRRRGAGIFFRVSSRGERSTFAVGGEEYLFPSPRQAPYSVSADRRLLRWRIQDRRLRAARYRRLLSSVHFGAYSGGGTGGSEYANAVFSAPLGRLRARVRRGRLRVVSAPGAWVRVLIRRTRGPLITRRYRQLSLRPATTVAYRFSCRKAGTRYAVSVRARDSYGTRRTANLTKRCR